MALWLCLGAAAGWVFIEYLHKQNADAEKNTGAQVAVRSTGLVEPRGKHLAPEFTDKDGRLLADPPAADQLLDPQTLVVAHLAQSDPDTPAISWQEFNAHLEKVTGRKVQEKIYDNGSMQMASIKDGAITIVAMHAADAPFLVNNYGYQPVAVLAEGEGVSGNHLDFIVPAKSSITKMADIRDKNLVCSVPSSITGYRAAIAVLMQKEGLRPNVDYNIIWSMGQKRSITGTTKGEYAVAAISDDKLKSLLKKGTVAPAEYRIIFESEVIPRTTIGYFCNLKPELAAKVREAILSFNMSKSAVTSTAGVDGEDGLDSSEKPMHFVATDYKKDFKFVREIDDRFDPRLDAKKPKEK